MSEELGLELRAQLRELNASLKERCPQRLKLIENNSREIGSALARLRLLENRVMKLTALSSVATSVLTAALVKIFVS
jgi:hypothetical protein